ncbi:hypothetical protein CBS101457_003026 [Exobasidium rhododendri]|nr:hypothetical protein CBS101457_003026 [Exobasidium rhododendri]
MNLRGGNSDLELYAGVSSYEREMLQQQQQQQAAGPSQRRRRGGQQASFRLEEVLWQYRSPEAQEYLKEVLSKRRGILYPDAEQTLSMKLTQKMDECLRSQDPAVVEFALNYLFPITPETKLPVWMNGMTDEESETLVRKLMSVTGYSKDVARKYLMDLEVQPAMAQRLLHSEARVLYKFVSNPQAFIDRYAKKKGVQ